MAHRIHFHGGASAASPERFGGLHLLPLHQRAGGDRGPLLDERTISIGLEALRSARHSCACIASDDKVPPLIGSLRAGLVDVLAIDSRTAETLLAYAED